MRSLFILSLFLATSVSAQSIQELEAARAANEAVHQIDRMLVDLKAEAAKRANDCEKAFGHKSFCGCLSQEIPVAFTFQDYIAITTRSKEENKYSKLSPDYKRAYDRVVEVRDMCIAREKAKSIKASV